MDALPPLLRLSDFQIGFKPPFEQKKSKKEKDVFMWMCQAFEITEGRTSALIYLMFSFSQTGDDDDDDDKLYLWYGLNSFICSFFSLTS